MNRTFLGAFGVVSMSILAGLMGGCAVAAEPDDEATDEAESALLMDYGDCLVQYEGCVDDCYTKHSGDGKLGICNTGCETIRELCAERVSRPLVPVNVY